MGYTKQQIEKRVIKKKERKQVKRLHLLGGYRQTCSFGSTSELHIAKLPDHSMETPAFEQPDCATRAKDESRKGMTS